ncbi:MAG: 50S ribosomal protein L31 [Patescibacteria group bacterium]|nr:50S ribosomal protein L31 [Patescibacteria group bacterium]
MKKNIHPNYQACTIKCACGNIVKTNAAVSKMNIEICSACHPFYTGKSKLVDSTGRVDRYLKRFKKSSALKKDIAKNQAQKIQKKKKSK